MKNEAVQKFFFFFPNVIFLGYLLHSVHIKGDEPYRGQLQICIFSYEPATLGTNEVLEVWKLLSYGLGNQKDKLEVFWSKKGL